MDNLGWGLQMTLAGMGTVFALLILLMALLMGMGVLDRRAAAASSGELGADASNDPGAARDTGALSDPDDPRALSGPGVRDVPDASDTRADAAGGSPASSAADVPEVRVLADGLTDEQIAAITVAVLTHRRVRRREAAPEMRTFTPGSHLYASRWMAVGQALQSQPWRRS